MYFWLLIYPNILDMIQIKHILLVFSLWSFSFLLFAQSDCNYMRGTLRVEGILHPTCFATCNGAVMVRIGIQALPVLPDFDYFIDGQKSLTKGLFQDLCPGRYTIVAKSTFDGCTDTISVSMIPTDSTHTTLNKTICNGSGFSFNNQILDKSGVYQAAFPKQNACDSVVILHLKVLAADTVRIEKTICSGTPSAATLTLKKSNGCDSVIVYTVKIAKDPNVKIIEQNKVLSIDSPSMIGTYQWFLDGKAITGATNSSFTAIADGVYYLEFTNKNTCKFISNSIIIEKNSTLDAVRQNIHIVPNPMQEQVTISADFNIEKVEIINTVGQILLSQNTDNQTVVLNTNAFANGVYFAKIYWNKKEFQVFRLMKKS
jgi:hypothetical protein